MSLGKEEQYIVTKRSSKLHYVREISIYLVFYLCFMLDYVSTYILLLLPGGGERNLIVLTLFMLLNMSPLTPFVVAAIAAALAYGGYRLAKLLCDKFGLGRMFVKAYIAVICGGELLITIHNLMLMCMAYIDILSHVRAA